MKKLHMVWTVPLAVSLGVNVVQWQEIQRREKQVPYGSFDKPLINKSVALYAAETRRSPAEAIKGRFAVTTVSDRGVCVNLRLPTDAIGWIPVYCFDHQGRLIYRAKV